MPMMFRVQSRALPGGGARYDVIAGPEGGPGIRVASHPIASVANDLALILNRIAEDYQSDPSDRLSRELTWDLLYRLELLSAGRRR